MYSTSDLQQFQDKRIYVTVVLPYVGLRVYCGQLNITNFDCELVDTVKNVIVAFQIKDVESICTRNGINDIWLHSKGC